MVGETPIAWGEAVQVFTIVIVTTLARNNGASGYRKEQSDPDMINHFRSAQTVVCFTNKQICLATKQTSKYNNTNIITNN